MNQCSTVEVIFEKELLLRQCKERSGLSTRRHQCLGALFHVGLRSNKDTLIAVERTDAVKEENYERINSWDDAFRIEIWKYPPINIEQGFADRLSLALTFMNNENPRIHKEVERIIEETWLKD